MKPPRRCSAAWATALVLLARLASAHAGDVVQGAGATFPAPLILQWASDYLSQSGVRVRYEAVGSGAGIARAAARQVDFGLTDAPLDEVALQAQRLQQFPVVIGGVVPVFNVTGIASDSLQLDAAVLADIYLGHITRWNDPRLQALNPALQLPAANITVVYRSDASGTSQLFSRYLALHSEAWRRLPGTATLQPAWPVGSGGSGNQGVASYVQRTRMSLGYVEYAYARANHLQTARLRNATGTFVAASRQAFEAAAASVRWDDARDRLRWFVDAPGAEAWPVAGASFALLPQPANDVSAAAAFFDWARRQGAEQALRLHYVPVPAAAGAATRE